MSDRDHISRTERFVKKWFANESSGHDWWHTDRVRKMALAIAEKEGGDLFIIELASLLHDVNDYKLRKPDYPTHKNPVVDWLKEIKVSDELIGRILQIVDNVSFKGAYSSNAIETLEGYIVQDADRLDAIGAIGIARAFAFGGHRHQLLYDPSQPPNLHDDFDEYKSSKTSSFSHFFEKLVLLKDLMNTSTAKEIANKRHNYLESYITQFLIEWNGADIQ